MSAVRSYRGQKAGLTRAEKAGPAAVIAECRRFVAEYDETGAPWPDDWHRWNIALGDASYAIARETGSWDGLPQHLDDIR